MKINTKKNINYIVIMNIIGTILYQSINFLLTPVLTRALGTADFGVVSVYTTWANLIFPIVSLSVSCVIPYIRINVNSNEQNRYISAISGLSLMSFFVVALIILIFLKPISRLLEFQPIVVIMLLIQCFGLAYVHFIVAYYIQYQRTILQFTFTIITALTTFAATLLLLTTISDPEKKYLSRIYGFAIPYFIIGLIAFFIIYYKGRKLIDIDVWKIALPICIPIIFHTISHIILSQSDRIMIQKLLPNGYSQAGIYSFGYTVASIGSVMWTAFNNAWTPFYYSMIKENDTESIKTKSNNYLFLFTAAFCCFYLVIPEFSRVFGGKQYFVVLNVIPVVYLSFYFVFLYSFCVNYKIVKKRTLSIAIGTASAGLINIILNFIMIPRLGIMGGALATLIAYTLLFVFQHLSIPKTEVQYNYTFKFYAKGIVAVAIVTALFYLLRDIWIIRWALASLVALFTLYRIYKQKSVF